MQVLDTAAVAPLRTEQGLRLACALIRAASTEPVIVGIDGRCGAGKTTFARRLAQEVGAAIVDTYEFYRPMRHDLRVSLTAAQAAGALQDWQRLRDEVLAPLRAARPTAYRRYERARCAVDGTPVPLAPRGVVLVDGTQSTRRELERFLDVRIFVQTPAEVCAERVASRRAGRVRSVIDVWNAAEGWYLEHDDPASRADLVVSGV